MLMMKFRMGETVHHFYGDSSMVKARVSVKEKKNIPVMSRGDGRASSDLIGGRGGN